MKKNIVLIIAVLMITTILAGCTNKGNTSENDGTSTKLSGSVTISGSTSVEPVAKAIMEEFMALHPDVTVTYEAIGSSGGIKNANKGVTQIGTASRDLKAGEEEFNMTKKVLAYDGIAVVVNPKNTGITDITIEEIRKIYTGEITNWKDLGGVDKKIVVVSREDGSGTRGAFEEIIGYEGKLTTDATICNGNGNVQSTVAGNADSIGFVSFTYLDNTVKGLKVEGVKAKIENVNNGSYKISRPFHMVYHEKNMTNESNAFIEFALSEDGQSIAEANGAIKAH